MPDVDIFTDCPGFAASARRENDLRSFPFLGLDRLICGFDARQMTMRHVVILNAARSPFLLRVSAEDLCVKPDISNDVTAFLWTVSPLFVSGAVSRRRWWHRPSARDRFNKRYAAVMQQPVDVIVQAILQYVEDAFLDAGTSDGERSYYSSVAGVSAALKKNYDINFKESLEMPLNISFQLLRIAQRWNNPDAPLENKLSDACIEAWMATKQPAPPAEKIVKMS